MCNYRKSFGTHHALLSLIEKFKKMLDNKVYAVAILLDLSNTLDTIDHDLLIAK